MLYFPACKSFPVRPPPPQKKEVSLVFCWDLPMSSLSDRLKFILLLNLPTHQRFPNEWNFSIFWLDFWYLYISNHLIRPEPGSLAFRAWFTAADKSLVTIRTHVRCINFYTFHWISIHTHTNFRRWWSRKIGNREER